LLEFDARAAARQQGERQEGERSSCFGELHGPRLYAPCRADAKAVLAVRKNTGNPGLGTTNGLPGGPSGCSLCGQASQPRRWSAGRIIKFDDGLLLLELIAR
jgi:hypothetical protein